MCDDSLTSRGAGIFTLQSKEEILDGMLHGHIGQVHAF